MKISCVLIKRPTHTGFCRCYLLHTTSANDVMEQINFPQSEEIGNFLCDFPANIDGEIDVYKTGRMPNLPKKSLFWKFSK